MKCPNCKEHNLVIAERKGIEIDHCPECRGIWLDRGELDKILEKSREDESPYRADNSRHHAQADYYQKPYKKRKSFLEELFD
jgi:hypothetical protein